MSIRTTPPFRADHVGSLLRPRALLQAREYAARGTISSDDLRAIEDDAIRDAVWMQENIGLRSVTDGKFVDIDQLCLSPQCGFSSTLEGNSLSRDQQIAMLRLVVETAEEIWGTQ